MISKTRRDRRGIRLRKRVKGSPGQWCPDMELEQCAIAVPRWLKRWVGRQPESFGLLFERAMVEWGGADPPPSVKECLQRQKQKDEEAIAANKRMLQRMTKVNRFKLSE